MQQPMMMEYGGNVPPRETEIRGQDHMLAYITPEEGGILKALGGAGRPGPMGIPSFFSFSDDAQATDPGSNTGGDNESNENDDNDFSDFSNYSPVDDNTDNEPFDDGGGRPEDYGLTQQDFTDASNVGESVFNESQGNRTNIVNVGPTSNLTYDPQFTADNLSRRGLDPQGFMSGDNFGQTTQGMQAATQAQRDAELSQANMLSGRSMPTMGDLGASQNIAGAITPANIASSNIASAYSPFSDLDDRNGLGFSALDDPLGLGINTGFGPAADAARNREALTGAFGTPNYRQEAGLPTVSDVTNTNAGSQFDRNNPNEMRALENAVRNSFEQQIDTTLVDTDRNFNKDGTISKAGITEENDMINSYMSDAIKGDKNVLDGLDFNASPSIQTANAAPITQEISRVGDDDTFINDINTGTKASSISNALNQPEAAIKDAVPSRSISDILSAMNQKTDLQSQVNQNFRNAGVNVTDRGRIGDINRNDLSDIIDGNIGIDPSIQAALNAQSELDQAPSSSLGFASNKGIPGYDFSMTDVNPNIAVEAGGKGIGANVDTSPPPADYEENVGKPYSGLDVGKVEDFYNSPTAFDRLGVPPGMFSTALNFAEKKARDFVASDLISGNFDPIYDRDGKITGSRNPRTGQVQSGMDFNAPDTGSNDNDDPIILPKRLAEEKAEEDKPPNVIGGGVPAPVTEPNPFIVDSPFTSNVGDYSPVGFSAGDLNALIAKLTGGVNPKSMRRGGVASYANGGLISAVDNFLASAR
jgi:hypothetical protein